MEQFAARRLLSKRARLAMALRLQRMYRAWKWRQVGFMHDEKLRAEREAVAALLHSGERRAVQAVARFYIFRRRQHKVIQGGCDDGHLSSDSSLEGIFYFVAIRAKEAAQGAR